MREGIGVVTAEPLRRLHSKSASDDAWINYVSDIVHAQCLKYVPVWCRGAAHKPPHAISYHQYNPNVLTNGRQGRETATNTK